MKRKYVILLHVAFWVLLLTNNVWGGLSSAIFNHRQQTAVNLFVFIKYLSISIGYLLIPIACFYGGCLFVAPQLEKKSYFKIVLYTLLTLLFVTALRYIIEYQFFKPVFGYDNYNGHPYTVAHFFENVFLYYFPSYFVYGLMYFFAMGWFQNKQRQQELQKEKAAAELAFLRSQINPHFLFNSINDIYSLTYQQSELAPVALLKLADILRYMLREGKEDTMLLQNEIKYLENVIELQRISTKGSVCINFNVEGYVGPQKIATLLLIAFVENAFKHGVLTDGDSPVNISLQTTPDKIHFAIRNKKNNDEKDKTGGIGLYNVKRRLALMYPEKHNLTIEDDGTNYSVNLTLELL